MSAGWSTSDGMSPWVAQHVAAVPRQTGTVVLEPTPAQLAAGVRVVPIPDSEAYGPIAKLAELARARGWAAVIAQSRYLSEPINAGDAARRGRRLEKVVQSLRLARGPVRAYCVWEFDTERAKWEAQGGRYGFAVPGGAIVGQAPCSVTALRDLIMRMGGAE